MVRAGDADNCHFGTAMLLFFVLSQKINNIDQFVLSILIIIYIGNSKDDFHSFIHFHFKIFIQV